MTKDQIRAAVRLLAGLFPSQVTQEHMALLGEAWAPLSDDAVTKAIKAHRARPDLENGFWNLGKLLEGCRAAEHETRHTTSTTGREGTWFDVWRRQRPQLAQASDVEVCVRVHRSMWHDYGPRSPNDRKMLEHACRALLQSAGMSEEGAAAWLPYVFDADAADFRQALEDLRNSQPGAQRAFAECPV